MFYILSILCGTLVVATRIINFKLSEKIGIFQGTLVNYIVGLFFSFIFLLISKEWFDLSNINLKTIPLWAYLGGLVGLLVVVLSSYITPKISAFYLTLFVFIGQLFVGIIIDFMSLDELSVGKIIGGLLVLAGLIYNLLLDKKESTVG